MKIIFAVYATVLAGVAAVAATFLVQAVIQAKKTLRSVLVLHGNLSRRGGELSSLAGVTAVLGKVYAASVLRRPELLIEHFLRSSRDKRS